MRSPRSLLPLLALLGAVLPAAPSAAALPESARYELVKGCYELRSVVLGRAVATDVGPFRMQATGLGKYLLYGKAGRFLAAAESGDGVSTTGEPSARGNWTVDVRGDAFTLTLPSGRALATDDAGGLRTGPAPGAFTFAKADGCATFPESEVNVDGAPSTFRTPWEEVDGIIDLHMHWMAFEFLGGDAHCGRPWADFGITVALVDCPDHEVPGSYGNVLEAALGGAPAHDTTGWPSFPYWPKYNSLTHETTYYRWVERAWRSGLRLMVNLYVDNTALCKVYPTKSHDCNEMNTVRLEMRRLREIRDYIDAQEGGPGKGWMKIVEDPFEARRVIAEGKMAVVQGIEVSQLFDCGVVNDVPQCTKEDVDARLDEMHKAGVRQMEIVNKFDNGFVGVAGDNDTQGVVVNAGNRLETGRYWDMKTCQGTAPGDTDKTQYTGPEPAREAIVKSVFGPLAPSGAAPVYPAPPHCNTKGLSSLGTYLLEKMMAKGMIIDPDHMSVAARNATLDLIEAKRYGGLVSSHSWSTPPSYARILKLGGLVTPIAGSAKSFVQDWEFLRKQPRDKRHLFGFGYGADMNGFHTTGGPRTDAGDSKVVYPFKSVDGKQTIARQRTGERTWDINVDGTAHYGMLPDWIEDSRKIAGDAIVRDIARGAEAYLQVWERAVGVPWRRPHPARNRFGAGGLGRLRLGLSNEALLRAGGQPAARRSHVFRYDVQRREGRRGRVAVALDRQGRAALVASTYPEHEARAVGAGDRTSRLERTRAFGAGVRIATVGRSRYVFGVRGGRIRYVAVATAAAARTPATLRAHLRHAGLA